MIHLIRQFILSWSEVRRFNKLSINDKKIVFYAESISDWTYFKTLTDYFDANKCPYLKVTSDSDDEYIKKNNFFYIGKGSARTVFFKELQAKCLILTLADLGIFYLKRSIHKVHYFYIFHSMVSTHRVYREHAFDNYDTILCVGDYQVKEIRRSEEIYKLNEKKIINYGYGRLDNLISKVESHGNINKNFSKIKVLIAPTWGPSSILNNNIIDLIEILLNNKFEVVLRPHYMSFLKDAKIIKNINKKFIKSKLYIFESKIKNLKSYFDCDIMISDWSGSALEYSFSRLRSAIFIDTKPKINNSNWKSINLPCFEDEIRSKIGQIVSINDFNQIPNIIKIILKNTNSNSDLIKKIRNNSVFNVGKSGVVGAKAILKEIE